MMIGSGIPRSQSSSPRPNPIANLLFLLRFDNARWVLLFPRSAIKGVRGGVGAFIFEAIVGNPSVGTIVGPRRNKWATAMAVLKKEEKAELVRQYLDRAGLDNEPLQFDLDRLFDDRKVRERVGEIITAAVLDEHLY
jgi:hypothetical protein